MRRLILALAIATPALSALAPGALADDSQAVRSTAILTTPTSQTEPPADHVLIPREAIAIARRSAKIRAELRRSGSHTVNAYAKGAGRWQVSWFTGDRKEIAQAVVDERQRKVVEAWTGPQVAWQMARGLPGAFGRKVNAPYVWIPLMAIFLLCLFDWRRPLRIEHLDLLVLLSFSASQYFFNRGEIDRSVPLVYPVLGYLLIRMLAIGWMRRSHSPDDPWRPSIPTAYLALLLIFLVGFRVGLNVTNSNVIDVGYSGVVGADRIAHGSSPYGNFPRDVKSGDTYGPVNYYAYLPFEAAFPWQGSWDDLPAAHAAAVAFDLATLAGLLVLGFRISRRRRCQSGDRGAEADEDAGRQESDWSLGVVLAVGWAAYPYTLYAMNANANDSLVAALLVVCLICAAGPRLRGLALAFAGAAKFVALALAPVFATYDRRRLRDGAGFAVAFVLSLVVLTALVLPDGGVREIYDRTVGYQLGRGSPFSIWGQHAELDWLQTAIKLAAVGLALLVGWLPRNKNLVQLAALSAAVLIAVQLTLTHWFYLYIVWWFPLVLVALLTRAPSADRSTSQVQDALDSDGLQPRNP